MHGAVFRKTIEGIRTELFKKNAVVASESNNGNPETIEDGFKVYVRKRPLLPHELSNGEYDVLTIVKPSGIVVHECKMYPGKRVVVVCNANCRIDMKRQYVMSCRRDFSKCFDQFSSTKEVYEETIGNFAQHVVEGGKAVCMMYGATGSGKTFTSSGMEEMIANDLFAVLPKSCHVNISCVEVAGSKCIDLHGKKNKVSICDDGNGGISLLGVSEKTVGSPLEMIHAIQTANKARATQATKVNAVSSRSHSICRLSIVRSDSSSNEVIGQFSLLDLAGTERSADSMHHTAERRRECIEINTSHMALKHCVRALTGQNDLNGVTYVPYRGSLLTRILKDCLWAPHSKACVIATVSPIPTGKFFCKRISNIYHDHLVRYRTYPKHFKVCCPNAVGRC